MSKTYEMMWDCEFCGSAKLLGKSHRYCPNCGAAQDPEKRYFPPENEKVAVEDHEFVGADKVCPSCDAANSAKAACCTNCGSPIDGSKSVQLKSDLGEKKPEPDEAKPLKKSKMPLIIGIIVVLVLICGVISMLTESKDVVVDGHSWSRSIDLERYQTVQENDWQDQVPIKGITSVCVDKERSTKQVEDGQECKTVKADNGDGTYSESEQCSTKYKEVPVYDRWCTYKIDKWKLETTKKETGVDLEPKWPTINIQTCDVTRIGCERQGSKVEDYVIKLKDPEGELHDCSFPMDKWKTITVGTTKTMEFNMVTGGIDCSTFDQE
jgi:hypothetical protein